MWWKTGLSSVLNRHVKVVHLYALILLQTDSSPSLTLAQLAKVVLKIKTRLKV